MIKRSGLISAVASLLLLVDCNPSDTIACDPGGCISENKLLNNLISTLSNNVVGYVVIVGTMPSAFGGQARTSTDPPATAMLPDLTMNVASVSKPLTAISVLQLLTKAGLTINANISPYIYPDWTQGPNINQVTFKQLLTHSSGFGQESACPNDLTYADLKTLVASGVQLKNLGVPSYGNCNFALLRELIAALFGQGIDGVPDSQRAVASSNIYISYMNQSVFAPVGIATSACTPAGSTQILTYPFGPGSTPGLDFRDWSQQCGSAGWSLRAGDVFKVINDLATGNILLTDPQKRLMASDCLGWDCAVGKECPAGNVCKKGDLYQTPPGAIFWTYAGIFNCDVPVIVYVNSALPSPYQAYDPDHNPIASDQQDISGLVRAAYNASRAPGRPRACAGQPTRQGR